MKLVSTFIVIQFYMWLGFYLITSAAGATWGNPDYGFFFAVWFAITTVISVAVVAGGQVE